MVGSWAETMEERAKNMGLCAGKLRSWFRPPLHFLLDCTLSGLLVKSVKTHFVLGGLWSRPH